MNGHDRAWPSKRPVAAGRGFTLTEVLIAAGILVLGFVLIAGTFPVGVKLTAMATERTIGLVAADEGLAKVGIYGVNLDGPAASGAGAMAGTRRLITPGITVPFDYRIVDPNALAELTNTGRWLTPGWTPSEAVLVQLNAYFEAQQWYPSAPSPEEPKYCWTALCRRLQSNGRQVQATVFVGRKTGASVPYPRWDAPTAPNAWSSYEYPSPVAVRVRRALVTATDPAAGFTDLIAIAVGGPGGYTADDAARLKNYFKEGATMLDSVTGRLMRVQAWETVQSGAGTVQAIRLVRVVNGLADRRDPQTGIYSYTPPDVPDSGLFEFGGNLPITRQVWVMPPALADAGVAVDPAHPPRVSGRDPCVGVYQTIISF